MIYDNWEVVIEKSHWTKRDSRIQGDCTGFRVPLLSNKSGYHEMSVMKGKLPSVIWPATSERKSIPFVKVDNSKTIHKSHSRCGSNVCRHLSNWKLWITERVHTLSIFCCICDRNWNIYGIIVIYFYTMKGKRSRVPQTHIVSGNYSSHREEQMIFPNHRKLLRRLIFSQTQKL